MTLSIVGKLIFCFDSDAPEGVPIFWTGVTGRAPVGGMQLVSREFLRVLELRFLVLKLKVSVCPRELEDPSPVY